MNLVNSSTQLPAVCLYVAVDATEHGDINDLHARLLATCDDAERKVVTLFGSGISNAVVPGVSEMTKIFRSFMADGDLPNFDEITTSTEDSALAYQNAASLVKRRRGDAKLALAIRSAVLHASNEVAEHERLTVARNVNKCRQLLDAPQNWRIPRAYRDFARFHATLPGSIRGPIFTTNFDPLVEMAFKLEGLEATAFPISGDSAPTAEVLRNQTAIPVLHMHGYWLESATLNTVGQLTRSRPQLAGLLRRTLAGSLLLVLGYGGWQDGFMSSLSERITEADQLDMEILWAQYSNNISTFRSNPTLARLEGLPGVTVYLDIDAQKLGTLLSAGREHSDEHRSEINPAPFGFTTITQKVAQTLQLSAPEGTTFQDFLGGARATWSIAASRNTPILVREHRLLKELEQALSERGGAVLAIGPMGEGKSIALKQVALDIARSSEWTVLWREPGAPVFTPQWLDSIHEFSKNVLICVDDADLIANELSGTAHLWAHSGSGTVFLLASQDRLWMDGPGSRISGIREVPFHGLDDTEAMQLASTWVAVDKTKDFKLHTDRNALAERLVKSSKTFQDGQNSTLFGAILDVAYGDNLRDRVVDMVDKLSNIPVVSNNPKSAKLSLIYRAIALMQVTFDPHGYLGHGAARSVLAQLVGLDGVFADGRILQLLGREAAISYSADRVYTRHPSIARAVIDDMRNKGEFRSVAFEVAKAAAHLRTTGYRPDDEYRHAYLLCKYLPDAKDAITAAEGAIHGSPKILESRITYLSVLRKTDPTSAFEFSRALASHIAEFTDYGAATRAFLVEASILSRLEGMSQVGVGLAALALSDGVGFSLDIKRAKFALVQLAKSAHELSLQQSKNRTQLLIVAVTILEMLAPEDARAHLPSSIRLAALTESDTKASPSQLATRLGSMVGSTINSAQQEFPMSSVAETSTHSFLDLEILLERSRSAR